MAKRPVKKKTDERDPLRHLRKHKCVEPGCKGLTTYAKRNRKTDKLDYFCRDHFAGATATGAYRNQHKKIVKTKNGPRVRVIKKSASSRRSVKVKK